MPYLVVYGWVQVRHPSHSYILFINDNHIWKNHPYFFTDDTFIHGWDFPIHGWFWQMKILSMDKIFSSMDGIFICNRFRWILNGKVLSMNKSVMHGKNDGWSFYLWISSMNKKYRKRRLMMQMDTSFHVIKTAHFIHG